MLNHLMLMLMLSRHNSGRGLHGRVDPVPNRSTRHLKCHIRATGRGSVLTFLHPNLGYGEMLLLGDAGKLVDGGGRGWVELRVACRHRSSGKSAPRLVEQGGDGRRLLGHETRGEHLAVVWEQRWGHQGACMDKGRRSITSKPTDGQEKVLSTNKIFYIATG